MHEPLQEFSSWGACDDCGFQGLLVYVLRRDEDYADRTAFGVMVDATCPACEAVAAVLVALEHFDEMQAFERARRRGQEITDD